MDTFFKLCGAVLLVCLLCLLIEKKEKDLAMLLSLAACCFAGICLVGFLEPVVQFVRQLQDICTMDSALVQIIFKVVGIGVLAEVSSLICQDAGKSALGRLLQVCGGALILWLSLPLFTKLLDLITKILDEL